MLVGRLHTALVWQPQVVGAHRALATTLATPSLTPLEACILRAESEDGVQECMSLHDEIEEAQDAETHTPLALCIGEATTDIEVDACVAYADDADEHSYG